MTDEPDDAGLSRRDEDNRAYRRFQDLRASGDPSLMIAEMNYGGVFVDADHARAVAELLLEAHEGTDELARQRPLTVQDKGDFWRVEGSWNREMKPDERAGHRARGPFFATFWKLDGRVLEFGVYGIMPPPPDHILKQFGFTTWPPTRKPDQD
jgi:hypothetical protein